MQLVRYNITAEIKTNVPIGISEVFYIDYLGTFYIRREYMNIVSNKYISWFNRNAIMHEYRFNGKWMAFDFYGVCIKCEVPEIELEFKKELCK